MSDALTEAQELYSESLDALRTQREQIREDLEFSDPSDPQQWDADIRRARENDPGGARPCLVLDQCGQYIANVAGQIEQQPPSLHAIPVGDGADKRAAEQIDGRFRHIEYASRAQQHYSRVLTSAARVGVGYLVIRPEVINAALNYQEPRITSEPDALKVVFDPYSTETDGSDATFAFLVNEMSPSVFKRRWPKAEHKDFGDLDTSRADDERKVIRVAEQWYQEKATRTTVVYLDENGQEQSEQVEPDQWHEQVQASGMSYQYVREYTEQATVIRWRMMSGADVLEESEYPADSIGVVPVYGYMGWVNGRLTYCGIPRRARSAQQAYNYHMSELMVPNTVIMIPHRGLAGAPGLKELWDRARVERRGFLPYVDRDEEGEVKPPSLMTLDGVNHQAGAEQSLRDIQASIGMYQANLGAPSNETSGVAIESRKEQGEASTAHFPSNMAASLGQAGRIVVDMDRRLLDARRQAAIIGVDQSPGKITVDPEQREAFRRGRDGVSINPNVGSYGVRVVVGASYSTQRTQTNAAFTEIIRGAKDPALVAATLPFWAQTLDFPGADKYAQAMTALAPPAVKAILQPEGGEQEVDPAQVQQQLEQCKQALQEALAVAEDAQSEVREKESELAGLKADREIKAYEAETNRLKVTGANEQQIQAITQQLVSDMVGPVVGQMDALMNQPQPEEAEEPMPDPEIAALQEGQQAIAEVALQIAQGQEAIAQAVATLPEMIAQLAALTKRSRKRIPVRDAEGNITEVIDRMDDEAEGPEG